MIIFSLFFCLPKSNRNQNCIFTKSMVLSIILWRWPWIFISLTVLVISSIFKSRSASLLSKNAFNSSVPSFPRETTNYQEDVSRYALSSGYLGKSGNLHTLVCLISVYPLLNVYRGILTIESERVHLEMLPNKRVQGNFLFYIFYQIGGVLCHKLDRT